MNKHGKLALLLVVYFALASFSLSAQSSNTKVSVSTLKSSKSKPAPTYNKRLNREYDSLAQALSDAAQQLQKAAEEMAKRAEERTAALMERLRQDPEQGEGAQRIVRNDYSASTIVADGKNKTVVNSNGRTVTIDNDSVWIESTEVKNGKTVKKKSVFPTDGRRVRVEGDSVYFDGPSDDKSHSISISGHSNSKAHTFNLHLDEASEEELRTLAKKIARGTDTLIDYLYEMAKDRKEAFMTSEEVQKLKQDVREAMEAMRKGIKKAADSNNIEWKVNVNPGSR